MKKRIMKFRILAILLIFIPIIGQSIELDLKLEALTPQVTAGEEPQFHLTVSNKSDVAVSILKIDKQVAYYELVVDKSGDRIAVSQIISDPLSLNPDGSDYIHLKTGEVTSGILSGYSEVLSELPSGDYDVHLQYTTSPLLDVDFKGASNKARISISQNRNSIEQGVPGYRHQSAPQPEP